MNAFISYSVVDKKWAGGVKKVLKELEIECFLAHEDLKVSEEWKTAIINSLSTVEIFIPILSKTFKESEWCSQEVGYIVGRSDVLIIPLSIDETIPYGFISHLQGHHLKDLVTMEIFLEAVIRDAILRKKPELIIPVLIRQLSRVGSYRGAESLMKPLVPHFNRFTDEEVRNFISNSLNNNQVWDAGLCSHEYIPTFLEVNMSRIPTEFEKDLIKKIPKATEIFAKA